MDTQTTTTAPVPAAKRAPRKTGKASKPAKPATKASASGKTPLKAICAKLGIEPKAARRLLRKSELSFHGAKERWVFTTAQADKVRELLKGSEIERE